MKQKSSLFLSLSLGCIFGLTTLAQSQTDQTDADKKVAKAKKTMQEGATGRDIKDEIELSEKAAKVFTDIMGAPDKAIPQELVDKAECIAVFPNVIKAGFVVGGRGGRGVASCRVGGNWSAPAYFNLGGGSFGLQIGAQATDFVFLIMNSDGVNSLLKTKFTMGADASVAAGPVGRQAGASTDAALNAQILSYSRSKGLFAGLELKGVVINHLEKHFPINAWRKKPLLARALAII